MALHICFHIMENYNSFSNLIKKLSEYYKVELYYISLITYKLSRLYSPNTSITEVKWCSLAMLGLKG